MEMKVTHTLRGNRLVVLALLACLVLAAFAGNAFAGGDKEQKPGQKGTIALSFPGLDVPMIGETYEVAKKLLTNAGYEVVGHDPHWDANAQRNDWDTWISARQVDLIAYLIVTDPQQWQAVAKKAKAAGVKLVSTNMTIVPDVANFMFEDDHTLGFDTGKAMAEWMQKRFKGAPRKVMVSMSENPMFRNRGQGVIDALAKYYPAAKVIEYTWGDHTATYNEVSNILTANPDCKILFNASEVAFAAYSAMLDAGVSPTDPDAGIFHLNIDNSIIPLYENPDSILRYASTLHAADWALAIASLAINAMENGPAIPYYATKLPVPHNGAWDQWLGGGFPEGKKRRAAPANLKVCYVKNGKWVNPNSKSDWPYLQDPNIPKDLWGMVPEPWRSNLK
jgi:ABC-type sugar transport system substrate-binding protein